MDKLCTYSIFQLLYLKQRLQEEIIEKLKKLDNREILTKEQYLFELDECKKLRATLAYVKKQISSITKVELTDGEIDLRRKSFSLFEYEIFYHNAYTLLGEIEYRGYHYDKYFGDIGYHVFPAKRGNGLAYKALSLLSEYLYKSEIPDFWITTKNDNVPSIKTIERYNGQLIETSENILLYKCQTHKRF